MLVIQKYGKTYGDISSLKKNILSDNDQLLEQQIKIAEYYRKERRRSHCKICRSSVDCTAYLTKNEIKYFLCNKCGHLNGEFEESDHFLDKLYAADMAGYANDYKSINKKDYMNRVDRIYYPKVEFLKQSLLSGGVESKDQIRVLDIGAGAGYFVTALSRGGFQNAQGVEVSPKLVEIAKKHCPLDISAISADSICQEIVECDSNVVSMIGVLEHVKNPMQVLESINKNETIKYIYLSLPLFSFSVFIENAFSDVAQRHLWGGHTHLFSRDSINYICNVFSFSIASEWIFGTDIPDLIRSINVQSYKNGTSEKMLDLFDSEMTAILDEMQLVLDKNDFSSEVHLLLSK